MALDGAKDFTAAGKAELAVELASIIETEDMVRLLA